MSYKAIISDWNGTLFGYSTDEILNKKLAYAILNDAKDAVLKGRVWRIADVVKLLKTERELKKKLQEYYNGERHLWEVYMPFNENVLRGRSAGFVNDVIDKYAKESADKIDERIIRPIQAAHRDGKRTAILSAFYDYSIRKILEESGYHDVFDEIVANRLQTNGDKVIGLTLEIYERKAEVLRREFFEKRGLRENNTLYFGDSKDDEPVAEILIPGNFIVPFFVSDEFKEKLASKYNAFVPENEEDLMNYLKNR